ncbi:MAG TPA: pseudouridine synthase [Candidatus Mcinerneyibacteriales bacterium]|nr:pseudouridine synthase [Candidatus Mcinerneyibacteriales bacterium]
MEASLVRLNKALKELGLASRREGDELIRAGYVTVNGRVVTEPWHRVDLSQDNVSLTSGGEERLHDRIYIAFYKPVGITCTFSRDEGDSLSKVLPFNRNLSYAGRLDKESEGLMILSDDGRFVASISAPEREKEKEYEVRVEENVHEGALNKMRRGMTVKGQQLKETKVTKRGPHSFSIILTEGKNRQIRRMASKVGLTVTGLKRVRIGGITLKGLSPGSWRELTEKEITLLLQ